MCSVVFRSGICSVGPSVIKNFSKSQIVIVTETGINQSYSDRLNPVFILVQLLPCSHGINGLNPPALSPDVVIVLQVSLPYVAIIEAGMLFLVFCCGSLNHIIEGRIFHDFLSLDALQHPLQRFLCCRFLKAKLVISGDLNRPDDFAVVLRRQLAHLRFGHAVLDDNQDFVVDESRRALLGNMLLINRRIVNLSVIPGRGIVHINDDRCHRIPVIRRLCFQIVYQSPNTKPGSRDEQKNHENAH